MLFNHPSSVTADTELPHSGPAPDIWGQDSYPHTAAIWRRQLSLHAAHELVELFVRVDGGVEEVGDRGRQGDPQTLDDLGATLSQQTEHAGSDRLLGGRTPSDKYSCWEGRRCNTLLTAPLEADGFAPMSASEK